MNYKAIFVVPDHHNIYRALGGEWVYETEPGPIKTSILNSAGVPIYRFEDRQPIGFDLSPRKDQK